LVCHSLKQGWEENQIKVIKQCFNAIPANGEPIATIAIGTGIASSVNGADFCQIVAGMNASKQKIILHCPFKMKDIKGFIRDGKRYARSKKPAETDITKYQKKKIR